jgi:hypothetical protein
VEHRSSRLLSSQAPTAEAETDRYPSTFA